MHIDKYELQARYNRELRRLKKANTGGSISDQIKLVACNYWDDVIRHGIEDRLVAIPLTVRRNVKIFQKSDTQKILGDIRSRGIDAVLRHLPKNTNYILYHNGEVL